MMFSKGLLEKSSRGLFICKEVKNRIALSEISRPHQKICFLLIYVQMSYDTKQKFWKHPKEKFTSLQISPKSGWSWQHRLE